MCVWGGGGTKGEGEQRLWIEKKHKRETENVKENKKEKTARGKEGQRM